MNITTDRDALRAALKAVAPAVDRHGHTIPALSGVRIDATGKTATVCAANMDTSIVADLADCTVDERGAAIPPHRLLTVLVDRLPPGPVTVTTGNDGTVTVAAGAATSDVRAIPVEDWPRLPTADDGPAAKFDPDVWESIRLVARSASTDTSRPILCGVRIADGCAVATDSYRMAWCDVDCGGLDVLLPAAAVAATAADDQPVSVACDGRVASIATAASTVTTRTIEGDYPTWRRLIPEKMTAEATVDGARLADAAATAAVTATSGSTGPWVRLTHDSDGAIVVEGTNGDTGVTRAPVSCDGRLAVTPLGLSVGLLTDTLAQVGDGPVTIGTVDNLKPVLVDGTGPVRALIMPTRVA